GTRMASTSSVRLMDLSVEILFSIGEYLDCRLGLPTVALTRYLLELLRTPDRIAIRALSHYKSPTKTFIYESFRSEHDRHRVLDAILRIARPVSGGSTFCVADSVPRIPSQRWKTTLLDAAVYAGNTDFVRRLLKKRANVNG
ncbi:hypothetical protein HDU93_005674, partial [Gonapodya sp. JEL0774]